MHIPEKHARRIDELMGEMTFEEKVAELMNGAPGVPRLGLPKYDWWNECLHGVARAGIATVFPQAIGMAAAWDVDLMGRIGSAIAEEARAKFEGFAAEGERNIYQGLTFWSPNLNIFRDPRWGRGQETYGEDPHLTTQLGVEFVKQLQQEDGYWLKAVATPKHFAVHSGPEEGRFSFDAQTHEQDLAATYLPHFKASVQQGGAYSMMGAYNRLNGVPCCANHWLLTELLREEWGFDGFVVSDCAALTNIDEEHGWTEKKAETAAKALKAGLDLECGFGNNRRYLSLPEAKKQSLIEEADVDRALRRLLVARGRLGLLYEENDSPFNGVPHDRVNCREHVELARESAEKGSVLLKNDNNLLPLEKAGRIAVIGPNADDVDSLLANYNGIPADPVTVLEGLKRLLGDSCRIDFQKGCDLEREALCTDVPLQDLKAEYFGNPKLEGEVIHTEEPVGLGYDCKVGFPPPEVPQRFFSVRWTGRLEPTESGKHLFHVSFRDGFRIYVDGKLILERWGSHQLNSEYFELDLTNDRSVEIVVEYQGLDEHFSFKLSMQAPSVKPYEEALKVAEESDVIIASLGLNAHLEAEEVDKKDLDLPEPQRKLLEKLVDTGKPVVLAVLSGSPVDLLWASENVPAIVQAWYPGEQGGAALANLLFGDANPSGRLPVTIYRSLEDIPPIGDYSLKNRTYRFLESEPLYPFGHGLSYTEFKYSELDAPNELRPGEGCKVVAKVKNVRDRAGEEVVQLYLKHENRREGTPKIELKAFNRVKLAPEEEKDLEFELPAEALGVINGKGELTHPSGTIDVWVGGGQPDTGAPGLWAKIYVG
jgi:beta-glucosidase